MDYTMADAIKVKQQNPDKIVFHMDRLQGECRAYDRDAKTVARIVGLPKEAMSLHLGTPVLKYDAKKIDEYTAKLWRVGKQVEIL